MVTSPKNVSQPSLFLIMERFSGTIKLRVLILLPELPISVILMAKL